MDVAVILQYFLLLLLNLNYLLNFQLFSGAYLALF